MGVEITCPSDYGRVLTIAYGISFLGIYRYNDVYRVIAVDVYLLMRISDSDERSILSHRTVRDQSQSVLATIEKIYR